MPSRWLIFLGALRLRASLRSISELAAFLRRRTYTLNCNWKVFIDNYLDGGYHVPHLHKGLNSVLDYRQYTIECEDRFLPAIQPDGGVQPRRQRRCHPHRRRAARRFWQYPNFMINLYSGYVDLPIWCCPPELIAARSSLIF